MEEWVGRWNADRRAWTSYLASGDDAVTVQGALATIGLRGRTLGRTASVTTGSRPAGAWQREAVRAG
jgi:hypothetical protein